MAREKFSQKLHLLWTLRFPYPLNRRRCQIPLMSFGPLLVTPPHLRLLDLFAAARINHVPTVEKAGVCGKEYAAARTGKNGLIVRRLDPESEHPRISPAARVPLSFTFGRITDALSRFAAPARGIYNANGFGVGQHKARGNSFLRLHVSISLVPLELPCACGNVLDDSHSGKTYRPIILKPLIF